MNRAGPIIVVAFQGDLGAGVPADELIGSRADRMAAKGMFVEIGLALFEDMFGDDLQFAQFLQRFEVTFRGDEADCIGIKDFARFDICEVSA